ncbi:hypothetical protein CJ739_2641 [Mariniflexile rhizosphaerae]|uniref:hypothetical protein n=1 Tax=unclassified Mariniflexile TaxID=2643887 RepID=UPI000CBDA368|nr:hypothetical protein [Mariniflexile sp. TRM1-10]AXP81713.1 hypothetical protein CJ739_2641 [Mariniflexile sp. TRM1-10]PLB18049.1 MAG: Membrane protein [Flavobacteriaceae bacterium FS1-H7996/R]
MILKNKRLFAILGLVVFLLLIPGISMLFTNEVNWSIQDFIIAGILLLSIGLAIEFILRKVSKKQNRIALIIIILMLLILTWIELAVGVFGTPLAGS